jgi:putative phosphonate metabolism protein
VTARYAIYFSPGPDTRLARCAASWLGRDCATGSDIRQPQVVGFPPARIAEITASARHYGFHATLKPPFALAEGCTGAALDRMLAEFAERQTPVTGLGLKIGTLDGFIALLLSVDSTELRNLAAACVRDFDGFRRPPSEDELQRRRSVPLTDLEDALLRRWGYPYVMEAFRFHMTLTSRLQPEERNRLLPILRQKFGPAATLSLAVDAVSLFYQEEGGAPFRLLRRYPFGAGSARSIATKDATDRSSDPSLTSVRTSSPST